MAYSCGIANCYRRASGMIYLRYTYPSVLRKKLSHLPADFRITLSTNRVAEARRRSRILLLELEALVGQVLNMSERDAMIFLDYELENLRQQSKKAFSYGGMPIKQESYLGVTKSKQIERHQSLFNRTELTPPFSIGPTFKEVADAFLDEKVSSEAWGGRTLKNRAAKVRNIIEMVGENKPFTFITSIEAMKVRDNIYRFPKNRTKMKNIRDKPLTEIFKMSFVEYETIDTLTANNVLSIFKEIFEFAVPRFHDVNVTSGITARPVTKAKRIKKRSYATLDARKLSDLLSAHHYQSAEKKKRINYTSDKFWVPLIGMFTGARVGEILQLRVCDVLRSESGDYWYFDLNDEHEGNRLKTDNSRRWIPVHSFLLQLGLLDFINGQGAKSDRVFSDVTYSGDQEDNNSFSKWFDRTLRKEIGWSSANKETFHSLRHTFVDNLRRKAGLSDWQIASVVGHLPSDEGLTTLKYGSHRLDLDEKQQFIEMLNYGIDLEQLSWPRYRMYFLS